MDEQIIGRVPSSSRWPLRVALPERVKVPTLAILAGPDAYVICELDQSYKWLAQDADGNWWLHEARPDPHTINQGWESPGRCRYVGRGMRSELWASTLVDLTLVCNPRG